MVENRCQQWSDWANDPRARPQQAWPRHGTAGGDWSRHGYDPEPEVMGQDHDPEPEAAGQDHDPEPEVVETPGATVVKQKWLMW